MLRLLWKWAAATFSVVVILLAIAIGLFRLIVPMIPQHHERIEAFASDAAGTPVRIGEISARWRWRGPELRFTDARLLTADGSETLLSADEGSIIIDLGALLRGEVRAGQVQLDGLQLQLTRDADNRWLIGGRLLDGRNEQKLPRLSLGLREAQVIFRDEINDAGPWVFDDVELDVELRAKTLAIDSVMQLPAGLGRRAELSLQADGELKNFAELDWQLYSRVDDIELFGWRALMPAGRVVPGAGRGDVVLWFGARGNRIQQISLQTDLSDLEFNRDDTPLRELEQLSGRFEFDRLAGGWQANGRDVQVSSAGSEWPVTSFSVEQVEDDSGSRLFYADLNYLRLEDFAPLLDWVPDEEWRQRLTTLAPRGVVEDLSIRSREAKDETASFSLRGQFDKLGFNPVESLPGITNLAGEMRLNGSGGNLQLKPRPVRIDAPEIFDTALQSRRVSGAIVWRRSPGGWRIVSDNIDMEHADFDSATSFELALPDEGSPYLDLNSEFNDLSFAAIKRFLPAPRLPGQTVSYLRESMTSGKVPTLTAEFRGPLQAFPFDDGEGEFVAVAEVREAEIAYARGWPAVTEVDGTVEFRNAGFSAGISRAQIAGNRVSSGELGIADFRRAELEMHTVADGLLENLHAFLLATPIGENVGRFVRDLEVSGDGSAQLDLVLPLSRKINRPADVLVIVSSEAGTARLAGLDEPLDAISGSLQFRNGEFTGRNIDARFLQAPVSIDVSPEQLEAGDERYQATVATVRGSVAGRELARLTPRWGQYLNGVTGYTAAVIVPEPKTGRPLSIGVASRLEGMAITLPSPLAKRRTESRDLVVDIVLPPETAQTDIVYADVGTARLNWLREDAGWSIERGGVVLGPALAELPAGPGVTVTGATTTLDLSGMLEVFTGANSNGADDRLLRSAEVTAEQVLAFGEQLNDARLFVDRSEREWLVQVDSDIAAGAVFVPFSLDTDEIIANMQRLYIGTREDEQGGETPDDRDPRDIPALTLQVDDFRLGDMQLGRLQATLVRDGDGIVVEDFATESASFSVRGDGVWEATQTGQRTEMAFTLVSQDLKTTLDKLGFDPIIEASDVQIAATLNWPGPPGGQFRENLNGVVELSVGPGQIDSVDPGAGRALGLLSFTALPRRMSLDFRDVFDKGFGFDYIEGDFTLDAGDAYTSNLVLEGPAAQVGIAGRTGLASRDYDQTAVVYGNFGAALPVAGAIAGGPVGGAAMLIFSELFKRPLQNMARINYRITGSWDDPEIERIVVATGTEEAS